MTTAFDLADSANAAVKVRLRSVILCGNCGTIARFLVATVSAEAGSKARPNAQHSCTFYERKKEGINQRVYSLIYSFFLSFIKCTRILSMIMYKRTFL